MMGFSRSPSRMLSGSDMTLVSSGFSQLRLCSFCMWSQRNDLLEPYPLLKESSVVLCLLPDRDGSFQLLGHFFYLSCLGVQLALDITYSPYITGGTQLESLRCNSIFNQCLLYFLLMDSICSPSVHGIP